jgi:ADP-heptose:LPS heptosyltransferase
MIEWLRRGRLVIANDTGPMHVAAALGKPLIAFYGPTSPAQHRPLRQIGRRPPNRHPALRALLQIHLLLP